jgi:hypothetical protein
MKRRQRLAQAFATEKRNKHLLSDDDANGRLLVMASLCDSHT